MNAVNSVILEGNVVRQPEMRQTTKGTEVCTVRMAVNRWFKPHDSEGREEVSFFDIDAWGSLAQTCVERCEKGRGLRVTGRLKEHHWQDTEGKSRSRVTVVAEHVEFRGKRDKPANDPALRDRSDIDTIERDPEEEVF